MQVFQFIHSIFETAIFIPMVNVIVALYQLFLLVGLPGAFGFAIITLTCLIRLALQPLFHHMSKTSAKTQELQPHLAKLKEKHKDDPKKFQEAQMKLYQEMGLNPAMGCLPILLMLPLTIGIYSTIQLFSHSGASTEVIANINKMLYWSALSIKKIDPWFLGYNLALSPKLAKQWHYYLIPVITGALQYLQGKYSVPAAAKPAESKKLQKGDEKKTEKTDSAADFQKAMGLNMKFMLPVMFAYFSYGFSVGLALYWNIFSVFSILQYRKLNAAKK